MVMETSPADLTGLLHLLTTLVSNRYQTSFKVSPRLRRQQIVFGGDYLSFYESVNPAAYVNGGHDDVAGLSSAAQTEAFAL